VMHMMASHDVGAGLEALNLIVANRSCSIAYSFSSLVGN
jgi:hypothetical protein